MDELNHDFQALALEGRAMGEVRRQGDGWGPVWSKIQYLCPKSTLHAHSNQVLSMSCVHTESMKMLFTQKCQPTFSPGSVF